MVFDDDTVGFLIFAWCCCNVFCLAHCIRRCNHRHWAGRVVKVSLRQVFGFYKPTDFIVITLMQKKNYTRDVNALLADEGK